MQMRIGLPARAARRTWLLIAVLALTPGLSRAQVIATKVHAFVSNPGFTVADTTLTSVPLAFDDAASTSVDTSFGGPHLTAASTVTSHLSTNAVGVVGEWTALSFLGSGSLRSVRSGGQIDFQDLIQVSSPVLANGTPVTVDFAFYIGHTHAFQHTSGANSSNNAGADYRFNASMVATPSASSLSIPLTAHRYYSDFGGIGTPFSLGLLNPATPYAVFSFDCEVGDTIDFRFRLQATISGSVVSTGVGQVDIQEGSGSGSVAIAFGASPQLSGVGLSSQTFSGSFPPLQDVTAQNAQAALPVASVPIPGAARIGLALALGVAGALALARSRGRIRRGAPAGA